MKPPDSVAIVVEEEEEAGESCGTSVGRGCAWCMINNVDIPMFFISIIVLYLSVRTCLYCVMVVGIVSALLCSRFRLLNGTLWASLIVLWTHDWSLTFGSLDVRWSQHTL
jgi:hypothetical protein